MSRLLSNSLAASTQKAYRSGYKAYIDFALKHGMQNQHGVLFPDENSLIYFITYCHTVSKLSYSSIKLYLSGLKHFSIRLCGKNPLCHWDNQPFLKLPLALRGIKKESVTSPIERRPITTPIVKELCQVLDRGLFDPLTDKMLSACITTAFFAFLRCGEICVTVGEFDPNYNLTLQDVQWTGESRDAFYLHLKVSKTDPFRTGTSIYLSSLPHDTNIICPVSRMKAYLSERNNNSPCTFVQPLFVYKREPLTRLRFLPLLRAALTAAGHPGDQYKGHSFRIGAATSCVKAGMEGHIIKTLGRWRSDCYERYIRTPISVWHNAHSRMARATNF